MTIWLVISAAQYYPAGVHDWELMTIDEDKAREAYAAAKGDWVTLVRIRPASPQGDASWAIEASRS